MPEKAPNPKPEDIEKAIKSATEQMVEHSISPTQVREFEKCDPKMSQAEVINAYIKKGWNYICTVTAQANMGIYIEEGKETKFVIHGNVYLVFQRGK